jgi:hypothetical protein
VRVTWKIWFVLSETIPMVKKKQISDKWVVVDSEDRVHPYSDFREALKHPGKSVRIMTEEFYKTAYEAINRKR